MSRQGRTNREHQTAPAAYCGRASAGRPEHAAGLQRMLHQRQTDWRDTIDSSTGAWRFGGGGTANGQRPRGYRDRLNALDRQAASRISEARLARASDERQWIELFWAVPVGPTGAADCRAPAGSQPGTSIFGIN